MWLITFFGMIIVGTGVTALTLKLRDEDSIFIPSLISALLNGVLGWLCGYFGMPELVGPFWGTFGWLLVLAIFAGGVVAGIAIDDFPIPAGITGSVLAVLMVVALFGSCGMFQANAKRAMIGNVQEANWTEDMQPIDQKHIRVVSKKQAAWLANKRMGEVEGAIGSRYKVGEVHIQRVKGELYWIAPLEFHSIFKWKKYGHTTGYVMVSAEDRDRKAELVTGKKFRYMPSACFSDNLNRLLYNNGYAFCDLTEYTFELDEEMNPWWVITVVKPTKFYTCEKVFGVVIVNPTTGEHKFYTEKDLPDWVDRYMPEWIAKKYMKWWGAYVQGWMNSWMGEENVIEPTTGSGGADGGPSISSVWLTYGDDGEPYWFTGMTSSASSDDALCGVMMMNSRTGKTKYYKVAGNDEKAVLQTVSSKLGADGTKWAPTQPILYNIYGEVSWAVPVVSKSQNLFQRLAIVRNKNSKVVLGKNKADAFRKYRNLLSTSGDGVAPSADSEMKLIAKRIARINSYVIDGNTQYSMYFSGVPKIFTCNASISPEITLAQPGDFALVTFMETSESEIPVSSFDIKQINLQQSAVQAEYASIRKTANKRISKNERVRKAKGKLGNMSDDELLKLIEKKK